MSATYWKNTDRWNDPAHAVEVCAATGNPAGLCDCDSCSLETCEECKSVYQPGELGYVADRGWICEDCVAGPQEDTTSFPCGYCGSTDGFETETDGWARCVSCGGC